MKFLAASVLAASAFVAGSQVEKAVRDDTDPAPYAETWQYEFSESGAVRLHGAGVIHSVILSNARAELRIGNRAVARVSGPGQIDLDIRYEDTVRVAVLEGSGPMTILYRADSSAAVEPDPIDGAKSANDR